MVDRLMSTCGCEWIRQSFGLPVFVPRERRDLVGMCFIEPIGDMHLLQDRHFECISIGT